MENQIDTLKVYKHHQHARVQKEGEDMWISSEDLRTEGSSDEETQSGSRGRRMKKNRKQRKSGIVDSSKSSSSLASTSSHSTESSAKDLRGCANEIEKSTIEANIDLNSERFSVLNNPFFTDVFPESAGTSGISLASSDSGMDALNLESRWRPKRGSLKYPILVEGQTTANYLHEIDGFFNQMMSKVKSLRSCPALENFELMDLEQDEPKLFKHLKNTPAVKEKLKYIERLDNEIKETMQIYKAERAERLQIQKEMCNEICKNPFPEKDAQLFLELCHFEVNGNVTEEGKDNKENTEAINSSQSTRSIDTSFIKRNIELARQGSMAGCSLTDEEKKKLEELLVDEEETNYNLEVNTRKKDSGLSLDESDDSSEDENYFISNAYALDNNNMTRMADINSELEKFTVDETEKEKVDSRQSSTQPQTDWKDAVLMEQRLKAINAKLDELRNSYESHQVEEIFMKMVRSGTLQRELSETESSSEVDTADAETSQKEKKQV